MSDEESDSSVFVSVLLEQLKYNYTTVENNLKKIVSSSIFANLFYP